MSKGKKKRRNSSNKAKTPELRQESVRHTNSKNVLLIRRLACVACAVALYSGLSRQLTSFIIFLVLSVVLWVAYFVTAGK